MAFGAIAKTLVRRQRRILAVPVGQMLGGAADVEGGGIEPAREIETCKGTTVQRENRHELPVLDVVVAKDCPERPPIGRVGKATGRVVRDKFS